jgi:hypothetical protein
MTYFVRMLTKFKLHDEEYGIIDLSSTVYLRSGTSAVGG